MRQFLPVLLCSFAAFSVGALAQSPAERKSGIEKRQVPILKDAARDSEGNASSGGSSLAPGVTEAEDERAARERAEDERKATESKEKMKRRPGYKEDVPPPRA